MQYQNDYILRLIEQMGSLIRRALERLGEGRSEEAYELSQEVIGFAVDIDPATVMRLSPQSLRSLLEMSNLDDRVLELIARAFEVEAEARQDEAQIVEAALRREQAAAVRQMLSAEHAN